MKSRERIMTDVAIDQFRVFKLSPVGEHLDSHHWRASRYKGDAIIVARDAAKARAIARGHFFIASAMTPQGIPANPWGLAGIVSCVEIEDNDLNKETEYLVSPEGFHDEKGE